MKVTRKLAGVVLAGAVLAAGGVSSAVAVTSSAHRAPSCDQPLIVHDVRGTAIKWQFVTGPEAAYFRIPRCSYVISGQRGSVVMTPDGVVVGTS